MKRMVAIVVLVAATAVACGQSSPASTEAPTETAAPTTSTVPGPTTTTEHEAVWVVVAEIAGSADKAGEPFTLTGAPCRLRYTTTGGEYSDCYIYLMRAGDVMGEDVPVKDMQILGTAEDSTILNVNPGAYYIEIHTINRMKFDVVVEEKR